MFPKPEIAQGYTSPNIADTEFMSERNYFCDCRTQFINVGQL